MSGNVPIVYGRTFPFSLAAIGSSGPLGVSSSYKLGALPKTADVVLKDNEDTGVP